ncbi:isochorismate synthase [Halomonas sp. AOP35-4E-18]|uniref:isochorismate synthase n=1 Tax=Halomonas sp. AOP35-4E-18 TaxID=3457686 RepID=UPI004034D5F0
MSQPISFSPNLNALRTTFEHAIQRAQENDQSTLVSASFNIDPIDPLPLLGGWDDGATPFFYWEGREPDLTLLAWGCALELKAQGEQRFARIKESWHALCRHAVTHGSLPSLLCGGFRFDPLGPRHPSWQDFDEASMMLANVVVLRQRGHYHFLCQHLVNGGDDPIALAARYYATLLRLQRPLNLRTPKIIPSESPLTNTGDRQDWEKKVEEAVQHIRQGCFGKVVLARAQCQTTGKTSPWRVIEHLRQQHSDAHLFACRRGNSCFLGSSPERLACIRDGRLHTHALAGTTARGTDPSEDARLGKALLHSPKDRHEHALVVEAIRTALQPHCEDLDIPVEPVLKRLPRVQHLNSPIQARLADGISIMDILQALHPTPAVGGYPRAETMEYIRRHEELDRGWYAAPLGWLDGNGNGDFLVALRSALINQHESRLFAGCGLVNDSQPAHEYQETRMKLATMEAALRSANSANSLKK